MSLTNKQCNDTTHLPSVLILSMVSARTETHKFVVDVYNQHLDDTFSP